MSDRCISKLNAGCRYQLATHVQDTGLEASCSKFIVQRPSIISTKRCTLQLSVLTVILQANRNDVQLQRQHNIEFCI